MWVQVEGLKPRYRHAGSVLHGAAENGQAWGGRANAVVVSNGSGGGSGSGGGGQVPHLLSRLRAPWTGPACRRKRPQRCGHGRVLHKPSLLCKQGRHLDQPRHRNASPQRASCPSAGLINPETVYKCEWRSRGGSCALAGLGEQ